MEYSGFSAQNVQAYIPEAIATDTRGYLTLDERPIIAALVNAVKQIGAFIVNTGDTLLHLTHLAVGTSAKPEGITMYSPNGSAFCIKVSDEGALESFSGDCTTATSLVSTVSGNFPAQTPIPDPSSGTDASSTATSTDDTSDTATTTDVSDDSQSTSTDVVATSTDDTDTADQATSTDDTSTSTDADN